MGTLKIFSRTLSEATFRDVAAGVCVVILLTLESRLDISEWPRAIALVVVFAPLLFVVRTSTLAFSLGFLLPIYAVADTSPMAWDALRVAIVVVLLIRNAKGGFECSRPLVVVLIAGLLFGGMSIVKGDLIGLRYGMSLVQACAIALCVGQKHKKLTLSGFVAGAGASAVAVFLEQHLEIVLGHASQGVTGSVGLGNVSTQTGPLFVLAIAVMWFGYSLYGRSNAFFLSLILIVGVLNSGSRLGVAALVAVVVMALVTPRARSAITKREIIVAGMVMGYTLIAQPLSVIRFFPEMAPFGSVVLIQPDAALDEKVNGFSSNRVDGLEEGLELVKMDPLVGSSFAEAHSVHTLFLTWLVVYGLVGLVMLVAALVSLAVWGVPWQIMTLVILVGVLEPTGLMSGGSTLPVLLLIAAFHPKSFALNFTRASRKLYFQSAYGGEVR